MALPHCVYAGWGLEMEKNMTADVYEKLAQHLDNLPAGFPRTDSGVEMRILRRLFSPEEAELATHISLIEEDARVIARRAGLPVEETARRLDGMEKKGLIFALHKEGKPTRYQALGYVVGIYEFQVNRMDPEIIRDFEEYGPTWFDLDLWKKSPQMRTIPVGESIEHQAEVLPYERAEELIREEELFAVAPCVCRQEQEIMGHGCGKPSETCLSIGQAANYYIHNGLGREINQEEALQLLRQANEAGLVLQPANAKEPIFICACCGCCCGVLKSLKRHPQPASVVATPFFAVLDSDLCNDCGVCETRCQMEAISLESGSTVLNRDRCIGCGLCVSTCSMQALSLERKPNIEQSYIPKDLTDTNIKLGQTRGKLNTGNLVGMLVKSKVDRLLATRN